MHRAPFFTRTSLGRLSVLALTAAAVCIGAAAAHATTAADGLSISGAPASRVLVATVGQPFSFRPTVTNPGNRPLFFWWGYKAAPWLSFSKATGTISGTPPATAVGTETGYIFISVTDGVDTAYLYREFRIKVVTSAPQPTISGTPPTSAVAGTPYTFQPTAGGPAGMPLSFSVQNKPTWTNFSIATGQLTGTPTSTQTGSYSNIVLSVSDGQASSALPAFAITVSASTPPTGSATVTVTPPIQNTDGSALTDLAGVTIYYGTSASNLSQSVKITGSGPTSYTINNLTAGTWYFGGMAYTNTGVQSAMSGIVSKIVP